MGVGYDRPVAESDRPPHYDPPQNEGGDSNSKALRRVAAGSIVAFFVYGVGIGLTYGSQLVIARVAGVNAYGVYAYVLAWIGVLAYVCSLGFDVALLRFIPTYQVHREWPLLKGVIQYAQRRASVVGLAIVGVGWAAIPIFVSSPEIKETFLISLTLIPILALVRIRCAMLRAFGGVASALLPDRVVRDGLLIAILGLAALFPPLATIDAPFVMWATLIGGMAGLGATAFALRLRRPDILKNCSAVYDAPAWRAALIPLVIAGASETLMNRTGTIMLGWMEATKEAGIYSLAFNIALVVTVPRIAVNTMFAPAISALHARKDKAMMQTLVTKAATWTFLTGILVALVLGAISEPFLAWFGPGYADGALVLRILLVSQVIAAGAGSQLYVMTMTGHEGKAALLLMAIALGDAAVTALLIGPFGMVGAAIATGLALVIWNVGMALFIWRHLRLLPGFLAIFRRTDAVSG